MNTIVNATIQKEYLIAKISISNLSIKDKELIADMLLDSFEFDDAFYDHDERVIKVGMWEGYININKVQEVLSEILQQMCVQFNVCVE